MTSLSLQPDVLAAPAQEFERDLEQHRRELLGYCYRMLGSPHDAEDAVQETLVRAWRGMAGFEGRAELRSWLYRIANNVCLNLLTGRKRRALAFELGTAGDPMGPLTDRLPADHWIQPIPDRLLVSPGADPADVTVEADTVRLAFIAALQHLVPRQRAVLILRDVLRWKSSEVADLLDTTTTAVDSALRRARSALARVDMHEANVTPTTDAQRRLLARYVDAFERLDVDALVSLLRADATLSMPPYPLWLRGRDAWRAWFESGTGAQCTDHRLIRVDANGRPAFAAYRSTDSDGTYEPFAIQVLDLTSDGICAVHAFLDPDLFGLFGMPAVLLQPPACAEPGTSGLRHRGAAGDREARGHASKTTTE